MKANYVRVDAKYEERVRIKHLVINPCLQAAATRFRFEEQELEIKLPVLPPKEKLYSEYAEAEADVWNKDGEIVRVYIYFACVTILDMTFELPPIAARHPAINSSLYSAAETTELDKESDRLWALARRAIDYWLRVVRWKTGLGLIDIDTRPDRASPRGGRLINLDHGGSFYSPRVGRVLICPKVHLLESTTWDAIAATLAAASVPPIYNEYLMSAQRRIESSDLRAATIDLAIAAESAIRQCLNRRQSATASQKQRNEIAQTPVAKLVNRLSENGFPATSELSWLKDIKELIKTRNGIMHRGKDPLVSPSFYRLAAIAVENLIAAVVTEELSSRTASN